MTTPILPDYVAPFKPVPNVTPFTIRDGATMLKKLDNTKDYIQRVLIPWINEHFSGLADDFETQVNFLITQVNEALINQSDQVDTKITELETFVNTTITDNNILVDAKILELETYVNTQVQQIIGESIEVQDAVVAGIVDDDTSITYGVLTPIIESTSRADILAQVSDDESPISAKLSETFPISPSDVAYTYSVPPTTWDSRAVILTSAEMLAVMTGKLKAYTPIIVAVPADAPNRLGNYYMYWSTDHDASGGLGASTGGIWLAYTDSLVEPWTIVMGGAGSNAIFVDSVEGDQTETPRVIALASNSWVMYYQQRGTGNGAQTTMVATSTDGQAWTRVGHALNWPNDNLPGDGHTGYAEVTLIGNMFIAYALAGGTAYGYQSRWYSMDGIHFVLDRKFTGYNTDLTSAINYRVNGLFRTFQWRGEIWGETAVKTPSAGGVGATYNQTIVGRMRQDMTGFMGGWYNASFGNDCYFSDGDHLYGVAYGNNGGSHGVILSRKAS